MTLPTAHADNFVERYGTEASRVRTIAGQKRWQRRQQVDGRARGDIDVSAGAPTDLPSTTSGVNDSYTGEPILQSDWWVVSVGTPAPALSSWGVRLEVNDVIQARINDATAVGEFILLQGGEDKIIRGTDGQSIEIGVDGTPFVYTLYHPVINTDLAQIITPTFRGQQHIFKGTGAATRTLPDQSTVPDGVWFEFYNDAMFPVTFSVPTGDQINGVVDATSVLNYGEWVQFSTDGAGLWSAIRTGSRSYAGTVTATTANALALDPVSHNGLYCRYDGAINATRTLPPQASTQPGFMVTYLNNSTVANTIVTFGLSAGEAMNGVPNGTAVLAVGEWAHFATDGAGDWNVYKSSITGAATIQSDVLATLSTPFVVTPDVDAVIPFDVETRDALAEHTTGVYIAAASGIKTIEISLGADTAGLTGLKLQKSVDGGANWTLERTLSTLPNNSQMREFVSGIYLATNEQLRVVVSRSLTHVANSAPVTILAEPSLSYFSIQG